jgi:hypothetical protein
LAVQINGTSEVPICAAALACTRLGIRSRGDKAARNSDLLSSLPSHFILRGMTMPSILDGQTISGSVSLNFSVAKVFAIFLVVAGHWFTGTVLWVPVTVGLFVFAFSSSYFTSRIYGRHVNIKRFWEKKLHRLGVSYWVILAFLSMVVLLKGGTMLHWHSLVHVFGLSGLLNWFSIKNQSGLGAGLWFFTLLLGFYVGYPYLAAMCTSKRTARLLAIVSIILAIYLQEFVKVGHELWLTSLGFILGAALGFHEVKISSRIALAGAVGSVFLLLGTNLLTSFKDANTALICFSSIFVSLWLTKASIPKITPFRLIAKLEKYLLEIFLVHTYLFVHITKNTYIDFALSCILIVLSAVLLKKIIESLMSRLFETKSGPGLAGHSWDNRVPPT